MTDERKRVDISIRRIGDEIWIEFYQAGLRVRFEQTREEITDLAAICQRLIENWDDDTRLAEERQREKLAKRDRDFDERHSHLLDAIETLKARTGERIA